MKRVIWAFALGLAVSPAGAQWDVNEERKQGSPFDGPSVPKAAETTTKQDKDTGLQAAEKAVAKLVDDIQALLKDPNLSAEQKVKLYELLESARGALDKIRAAASRDDAAAKLDAILARAALLQRAAASYLGEKDIFGYDLKKEPIEFEIGADVAYQEVIRKLPFLRGAVNGRVRINPGQQIVTQFNALKAELFTTLLEAAAISNSDKRLKGIAAWAKDTRFRYPNASSTSTEGILTPQQYWSLELR